MFIHDPKSRTAVYQNESCGAPACVDYADPFQGNGEISLPEPDFPASTWHPIKALSGNTTPAACLPFGRYSVLSYDGAYPSGYGINRVNWGGAVNKLFNGKKLIGLSHFHQSGTGAIGVYYCYALTIPFYGEKPELSPRDILSEAATPGYYAAAVEDIFCEATVSEKTACHRYRFEKAGGRIAVDFANDGLYSLSDRLRGIGAGSVTALSADTVAAEMCLSGMTLYFRLTVTGASLATLWRGDEYPDVPSVSADGKTPLRLGCLFDVKGRECEVRLAVSAVSPDRAAALLLGEGRRFDEIRAAARRRWEAALGKIEIDCPDEREKRIFYSNLYHTLIKPINMTDEAFFFDDPAGDCVTDIATMWDIYKTQLPLLFTLFPDVSEKILATFARFGERYGYFPHCLLLSGNTGIEAKQARMLAEYAIADGFFRGIPADYRRLLSLSEQDAARFPEPPSAMRASHLLDMSEAFLALAEVADAIGEHEKAVKFASRARSLDAFDPDGLMRADSEYYEGNRYNYSFRPLRDTKSRIAIAGRETTLAECMRFFGFNSPEDYSSRFEGFNNETDMEAPYFLHYLGRRDLMCRVIVSGLDSVFTTGDGGIPGNADSGGLTACYLWNALGVFPVTGQNLMIVGTPRFPRAVLHTPGGDFTIVRHGEGETPVRATLNGNELPDFTFPASATVCAGTLDVYYESFQE